MSFEASEIFFPSITGFLPPFLPPARAASSPAIVLSRIRSLSNSATAPKTWNTSLPPGVVVSMISRNDTTSTLRSLSPFTKSISSLSERPKRSSFQTTNSSPCLQNSSAAISSGRSSRSQMPRDLGAAARGFRPSLTYVHNQSLPRHDLTRREESPVSVRCLSDGFQNKDRTPMRLCCRAPPSLAYYRFRDGGVTVGRSSPSWAKPLTISRMGRGGFGRA